MDVEAYFRSLSLELNSLKDRVRHVIDNAHWPTDGEWKESVLRSVLRRHLPASIGVGRGFVVAPQGASSQIDVLLYDAGKPVIFRDGDLVLLTSDAVKGIVEVKSRTDLGALTQPLAKLADNSDFLFQNTPGPQFRSNPPFIGLFAYAADGVDLRVLERLANAAMAAGNRDTRIVNHVALGDSFFARYWQQAPGTDRGEYRQWHAYSVENMAFGYFIHNLVQSVSGDSVTLNRELWFPRDGKERGLLGTLALGG